MQKKIIRRVRQKSGMPHFYNKEIGIPEGRIIDQFYFMSCIVTNSRDGYLRECMSLSVVWRLLIFFHLPEEILIINISVFHSAFSVFLSSEQEEVLAPEQNCGHDWPIKWMTCTCTGHIPRKHNVSVTTVYRRFSLRGWFLLVIFSRLLCDLWDEEAQTFPPRLYRWCSYNHK